MKICEKEFTPKFSLRSLFAFEQMTGKTFELSSTFDFYIYFYACLLANKENPTIDFEEFINYCDEHYELINEFRELLEEDSKRKNLFNNDEVKKKKKEVKK